MVKKMFYLLLLLSLLFGYHFAFAQDIPTSYRFEVGIPGIVGKNQSLGIVGLPDLILKSVTMLYVVGAIIAFISLIVAGFQYITSQGNASKTKDAMDRVQKAFIGLLILLGAYAILYTINPDLVKIPQNLFMPSKTLDSN